jgi:hypothetical protein
MSAVRKTDLTPYFYLNEYSDCAYTYRSKHNPVARLRRFMHHILFFWPGETAHALACESARGRYSAALIRGPYGITNMIKKIVLTAAVAAFAASLASAPAFAMKKHAKMAKKCTAGQMTTGKPNNFGWAVVSSCGMDGKMYAMPAMCYTPSGMCPK